MRGVNNKVACVDIHSTYTFTNNEISIGVVRRPAERKEVTEEFPLLFRKCHVCIRDH